VVNRLARADPGAPEKLAELAAALRAAQEAGHGPRLRELSAARGSLVDALAAQALAVAEVADPPPSLRLEVTQTLTAAIADPEVAADFAAGTLTHAVQWSGFGVLPAEAGAAEDTAPDEAAQLAEEPEATSRPPAVSGRPADGATTRAGRAAPRPRPPVTTARPPRPREASAAPAASTAPAADAARRQAELDERLAREAAERAARRQEQYEEAERLVAASAATAAEAISAEDRLEAEVRDLEQRLTQARADLAAARMRARHAEAAERRARQARDRLPREPGG
jgi:hypothetical protein